MPFPHDDGGSDMDCDTGYGGVSLGNGFEPEPAIDYRGSVACRDPADWLILRERRFPVDDKPVVFEIKKQREVRKPEPLPYWPYCEKCHAPFQFEKEEPFAFCSCPGHTEWGDPRPADWVPDPNDSVVIKNHERYLKLRNLGFSTSKHVAHTLGGNALKAEASFHYWCTPQRLDQLLDELP